jgi:hypothetical protein
MMNLVKNRHNTEGVIIIKKNLNQYKNEQSVN